MILIPRKIEGLAIDQEKQNQIEAASLKLKMLHMRPCACQCKAIIALYLLLK